MKCQCVIHAVGKAFNGQESERVGIRISLVYCYTVHVCIGGYLYPPMSCWYCAYSVACACILYAVVSITTSNL